MVNLVVLGVCKVAQGLNLEHEANPATGSDAVAHDRGIFVVYGPARAGSHPD